MTRPLLAIAALACVPIIGCSDSEDGVPPAGPLEIGTGLRPMSFEPLPADPTLPIEPGIQGGYHVQVALRADGIGPNDVEMDLTIESDSGERLGGASYVDDFFEDEGGRSFYGGITVFLDLSIDPASLAGQPLVLHAELSDGSGATAIGDLVFRAEWDGSTPLDL